MLCSLTPAKAAPVINNGSPTILGKRSYEQHNGVDGEWEQCWLARAKARRSTGPDTVFSPLCPLALPGNMKKRLLMPSRGKAQGSRLRPARQHAVCAVLPVLAPAGGPGHAWGRPHGQAGHFGCPGLRTWPFLAPCHVGLCLLPALAPPLPTLVL